MRSRRNHLPQRPTVRSSGRGVTFWLRGEAFPPRRLARALGSSGRRHVATGKVREEDRETVGCAKHLTATLATDGRLQFPSAWCPFAPRI